MKQTWGRISAREGTPGTMIEPENILTYRLYVYIGI